MDDFVSVADIVRNLGCQSQYGCRYADGGDGYTNLAQGLRVKGNSGNYCDMTIHKDDAGIFKSRLSGYLGKYPHHKR